MTRFDSLVFPTHSVRLALCTLVCGLTTLGAQTSPKGLRRSVDSFTGDTIVATDYGRLNQPSGCGRSDLAIILMRHKGGRGTADFLTYQWIKIDDPFGGKAYWLNGMNAFLNVDGEIIELQRDPQSPNLKGAGSTREESGAFVLPPGALERIASTPSVKLRIKGTDRTCDGTFEPNITARAALLVGHLPSASQRDP
ncbi:MAG: hypothetical protein ABIR59_02180 [Gemmatimonadales bacterium]